MSTRAPRRGQGGYFRTKSVEQSIRDTEEPDHALNKSLSALDLTVFGVGVVIGTGIFVLTGQIARDTAGPSVALAFLVSGLVCALAALCYAEFASTVPVAGSAYTFSYASLGELPAWIIGWDLMLELALGCAVVAVGWSGYVRSLMDNVGWHLPDWLSGAGQADGFGFDLFAFVLVGLVTVVLVAGMKLSARVTTLVVAIKLGVVLLVIVAGAFLVEADNYRPFIPPAQGTSDQGSGLAAPLIQVMFGYEPTTFGVQGVFTAAAVVFFAYIGFDIVATAAEETRDPQRDVPRGLLGSLAICTLLYVAVSLVVTGMRKYTELTADAPLADAFKASGHPFYSGLISFGAAVGLTTVCLILLLGQTRVFFAMSRDGLLPRAFSQVHPRFGTPYRSTVLLGAVVAVIAGFTSLAELAELVNIGTLFAFVVVAVGVVILRRTRPDLPRGFRAPLVPALPVASVLASLWLMLNLPTETWLRFAAWMALGCVIYVVYGRSHSRMSAPTRPGE
ncbi:amino acid permease [Streptomyces sp. 71268]|uniref:amino acid permease n=1 Tax=Streptomyces sp. 71268 TaxID=3002640 RepID=UPI0023F71FD6|nr:amino acid permease [Streptomyces sp. 71268]WEV24856.1 amino acid permease [Streptomyces sp. 71268]